MGVNPISFIFVQLWLLCAAVRPSIDEEDFGHRSSLLLEGSEVRGCPEEAQQKLREQLQGLGISREGQLDPCRWTGIDCNYCRVRSIESHEAAGDLSFVKEMTTLQRLILRDSQVTGHIAELSKLKELWILDLAHTRVVGNVTELSKLEGLIRVDLTQTRVVGDLAELSKLSMLKGLKRLFLAKTHVVGDAGKLLNLESLREVDLAQTRVVGDLAELSKLKGLAELDLSQTQVTGNVAELSKLGLTDLGLSQTQMVGDLAALSKLERLETLHLSQSQVVGNVSALCNLTRLKKLYLSQTQIVGELGEVSKLKELWNLHLSQTRLVGDVGELAKLSKLTDLQLSQTKVHGDISVITRMPYLVKADFSSTAVSGELTGLQRGCMNLRELRLGDTQVWMSPAAHSAHLSAKTIFFPALQFLNVSGCNLKVSFMDMFGALVWNPISSILAAGCGLTGNVHLEVAGSKPLLSSLQLLDISANRLDAVFASPSNLRLDVSRNEIPLRVSPRMITAVAKSGKDFWMMDTELANREEIMANCSDELQLEQMWTARDTGGYSCHDLVRRNLQVTAEWFLPDVMCACSPGHFGSGTNCSKCPKDTFTYQMGQTKCQACPEGGKAPAGSQSLSACKCPYGTPGNVQNETLCRCDPGEALSSDHECRPCGKLHLVCNAPGSLVATAPLEQGYIRLKEPSEEIFECLDRQHCRNSTCIPGRTGPLCASCAQNYRASKEVCIECKPVSLGKRLSIGLGCAATLVIVATTAWIRRRHAPEPSPRSKCLRQLLLAQLLPLLQLTQLWTVLGGLTPVDPASTTADAQGDTLFEYLETLQLTSSELQNFLALQCVYDGVTVRSLFALATPLVPLVLLIACGCVEVFSPGLGIRVGLKVLTVLFIGGASGSAQLLGCQRMDGAGTPLKKFAFRPLFPHEQCEEDPWVDRIGWATSTCYGLFIPCFLAFLFAKQNVVMQKVKLVLMHTTCDEGTVKVWLQGLDSKQSFKDAALFRRLAAAAAACVAIDVDGRAVVELQEDAVIVTPTTKMSRASDDSGVSSLIFDADMKDTKVLQRHVMAQMLMERSILEEETDRFMLGAKQLFCKYAKCENVWMEVCTKVAAAALVSVVAVDNLWLCVAITLGMALVIGLTQPFAQPQMNVLQSACFGCLALAAVGFRHHMALAWLALAVPFVLLVLQLRRPDSPEMLALRLQQELEAKIHEGPVEVSAEQFT